MPKTNKMSVKAFWEAVEQRLAASSADELRAVLRAMAQETPPLGRQTFLSKLKPAAEMKAAVQKAIGQEDLLQDIDDLADEIREAMQHAEPWEDEHDWYGYDEYDEEEGAGPYEKFLEPLSVLFDRAEAAFDYGDLDLARQAYQKLYEVIALEDEYGNSISTSDLDNVDMAEAGARYLRAVYETEPPARRPKSLFEQMQQTSMGTARPLPMLQDIIEISTRPLPDSERFFEDWIAFLRKQKGGQADLWLREAIRLSQGTAGLEALARKEGLKRPRAYLAWFTALEAEGKHAEVLAAAQQALQILPDNLPIRAAIADHLCAAAAKLGEVKAARAGRWEAFVVKPNLARLLDLWEAAPNDANRPKLLQQAARHVQDYLAHPPREREVIGMQWKEDGLEEREWITPSVLAHAYLLAGDWDAAHHLAAREQVLGWSYSSNTQGLVTSFFLVLLSGKSPALPPNLKLLWQSALQNSTGSGYWGASYAFDLGDDDNDDGDEEIENNYGYSYGHGRTGQDNNPAKRLEQIYTGVLSQATLNPGQRNKFLAWCLDIANKRVDAIVGGLHRKSYNKAALLTAACAETLQALGDTRQADALLEETRNRYPRHRAFQSEMDTAMARMGRPRKRKK